MVGDRGTGIQLRAIFCQMWAGAAAGTAGAGMRTSHTRAMWLSALTNAQRNQSISPGFSQSQTVV